MGVAAAIRDDELTAFAEGRGKSRKVSVIVEANAPIDVPAQFNKPRPPHQRATLPPPAMAKKAVTSASRVTQTQDANEAMDKLRRDLESLGLAEKASENDFAGVFVIEVTPTQLRNLANLESVRAIRPNKLRRIATP